MLVGLPIGSLALLNMAADPWSNSINRGMAIATGILAPTLGYAFARRAIQPSLVSGIGAAATVTVVAVLIGAVLTGAVAAIDLGESPEQIASSAVGLGVFGLVFLGVPALLLIFPIAFAWVCLVRAGMFAQRWAGWSGR